MQAIAYAHTFVRSMAHGQYCAHRAGPEVKIHRIPTVLSIASVSATRSSHASVYFNLENPHAILRQRFQLHLSPTSWTGKRVCSLRRARPAHRIIRTAL